MEEEPPGGEVGERRSWPRGGGTQQGLLPPDLIPGGDSDSLTQPESSSRSGKDPYWGSGEMLPVKYIVLGQMDQWPHAV